MGCHNLRDEYVDEIVDATQGFPQHVIAYSLAAEESAEKRLDKIEVLHNILVEGDSRRYTYYRDRLMSDNLANRYMRSDSVLSLLGKSQLFENEIFFMLSKMPIKSRRNENDPDSLIDLLIQKGILTEVHDTTRLTVQIPSFRDYLLYGPTERDLGELVMKFKTDQLE